MAIGIQSPYAIAGKKGIGAHRLLDPIAIIGQIPWE